MLSSNEKEAEVPALPHKDPVDVPVSVLRISSTGLA